MKVKAVLRVHQWTVARQGEPIDLGWGVAYISEDNRITRTCKSCGATVTSAGRIDGGVLHVDPVPVQHGVGCTFAVRVGI